MDSLDRGDPGQAAKKRIVSFGSVFEELFKFAPAGIVADDYFENFVRPMLKQGGPLACMLETGGPNFAIISDITLPNFVGIFS